MPNSVHDVLVIGCGGFGSAALCHLASRGLRVLGLDQFCPPHDQGSSHGETRVIRKAYFEHPDYVPLLHRAYELWDDLSQRTPNLRSPAERELFVRCGLLLAGPADGEVISGVRESARQHSLDIQALTQPETSRRFPGIRVPEELDVVFEPDAGFLRAERCVEAHLSEAVRLGATWLAHQRVLDLQFRPSEVTVTTDSGKYSAAAAVVTAGAWTSRLLPEWADWVRVRRKTLFWHPVSGGEWTDLGQSPIHLFELAEPAGQFYGFPSVDGQTVKLAEHTGGEWCSDPALIPRTVAPQEGLRVGEYVQRCLVGVRPEFTRAAVCLYSMSPDGHFILDRIPESPVVVAAGFSGHGFKFTSVLGEALADLIQNGRTSLPIGFLSAGRLKGR